MSDEKRKSDIILEEVKKRRGREKIVDVEEERTKIVVFSLLDDYYAFYGDDVKEILHLVNIYYVPGSPDFILGVVNIRGDIESVLNINKFLGLPDSKQTNHSRIAVAAKDDMRSGVLVDSIIDVIDVPVSSIKPPLSTLNNSLRDFVTGEMLYDNKNVTLLDVEKIFGKITV